MDKFPEFYNIFRSNMRVIFHMLMKVLNREGMAEKWMMSLDQVKREEGNKGCIFQKK